MRIAGADTPDDEFCIEEGDQSANPDAGDVSAATATPKEVKFTSADASQRVPMAARAKASSLAQTLRDNGGVVGNTTTIEAEFRDGLNPSLVSARAEPSRLQQAKPLRRHHAWVQALSSDMMQQRLFWHNIVSNSTLRGLIRLAYRIYALAN